jgi:REP element-mobilizing transposase RayT
MASGVVALEIEPDHVHLFVKAHPKHPPWIATLEVTGWICGAYRRIAETKRLAAGLLVSNGW